MLSIPVCIDVRPARSCDLQAPQQAPALVAAELALKFVWETENEVAATNSHDLLKLFNSLLDDPKEKIRTEYLKRAKPPKEGWETADKVFETCKDAFVHWRYLGEGDQLPDYKMQATYLKHATLSVVQVCCDARLQEVRSHEAQSHP